AWGYLHFAATPDFQWLLYGIKPVVLAMIAQAFCDLGRKVVKGPLTAAVGLAVLMLSFLGVHELALLFAGGMVVMVAANFRRLGKEIWGAALLPVGGAAFSQTAAPFSQSLLFLKFLKIGAVLYGSGYVLLAFLRADFVVRYGWLTD